MATERRLAAILSADVAGYSRLMGADEEATSGRSAMTPSTDIGRALLTVTLGHQGRFEEAQAMWAELMENSPDYSFAEKRKILPYKNPADLERIAEGLRKAGIEA